MRLAAHAIVASTFVVVGGSACAEPEFEPEVGEFVARGQHVELWASEGHDICGGTLSHLDRFVDALRERVGPQPEAEDLHRVYVLDDEDWSEGPCDEDAGGCAAMGRTVYTRGVRPALHELVHTELSNRGNSCLEEGLAVVFGEATVGAYPFVGDGDEHTCLETTGAIPFDLYHRAAHVTRYLINEYDLGPVLAFKRETSRDAGFAELHAAFLRTIGDDLDEVLVRYEEDYPVFCQNAGYRISLLECSVPATPWRSATLWDETVMLDCADANVVGWSAGERSELRTIEIDEVRKVSLVVTSDDEDAHVLLAKCDSDCVDPDGESPNGPGEIEFDIEAGTTVLERLEPGKYWLRFARPSDGEVTLTISDLL